MNDELREYCFRYWIESEAKVGKETHLMTNDEVGKYAVKLAEKLKNDIFILDVKKNKSLGYASFDDGQILYFNS